VNGVIVEIRWMEEEEKFCHLRKGGDLSIGQIKMLAC